MATAPLVRFKTTAGSIQIDNTYKNLCVRYSGSATTAAAGTNYVASKATITVTATNPIIAVRSTSYYLCLYGQTDNGDGTWTFDIRSDGAAGTSFDYWIFDNPQTPSSNVGLTIKDAAGAVTFWSGWKQLRVRAMQATPGSSTNYTYDSGRNYAIIFGNMAGYYQRSHSDTTGPGGQPGFIRTINLWAVGGKAISNGINLAPGMSIYDQLIVFTNTNSGDVDRAAPGSPVLVVDVTDY